MQYLRGIGKSLRGPGEYGGAVRSLQGERVFLVNPKDTFLEKGGDRPPLGIAYISGYVKQFGADVKMYDLNHDREDRLIDDLYTQNPSLVSISVSTPGYNEALRLNQRIKDKWPGYTVAGGHHVTAMPDEFETVRNFDYILRGDGEEGMARIMGKYPGTQVINSLDLDPLDQIPYPDRENLNMDRYTMRLDGEKGTTMVTGRGCLYNCNYCGSSTIKKLRQNTPKYVIGEMKQLMERFGYKGLYIADDIFTFSRKRVSDICSLMKSELKTKPIVRATTRVDLVDRKLLEEMYDAGFDILSFGLESGNDKILRGFDKGTDKTRAKQTVEDCHNVGIKVKGFWIMGLPGETRQTMQDTIDFAKELECEYNDVYPLVPYPSSQLWKNPKGIEIIKPENSNWQEYYQAGKDGQFHLKIKHPNLTEADIMEYVSKFRKEMNPGLTY